MTRRKTTLASAIDMVGKFVDENPKLATTLAFELGSLLGSAVRNSGETGKYIKKQAKKLPRALPRDLTAALKFLPSPKVQPRKGPQAKRTAAG